MLCGDGAVGILWVMSARPDWVRVRLRLDARKTAELGSWCLVEHLRVPVGRGGPTTINQGCTAICMM